MSHSILDPDQRPLTHRERFQRLMHFQTVDRGVHWEFSYLATDRWYTEGLSREVTGGEGPGSVEAYFGVDPTVWVPLSCDLVPPFTGQNKVLEEKGDCVVVQQPNGMIFENIANGKGAIPRYIKFPIANRDDWKRFKERLDPGSPERHRTDWKKIGDTLRDCDIPVGIWLGSFFGVPRDWIGFENIAMMVYDDRPLVEEIVATLTDLYISQLEPALREIRVDYASGWEDICFRSGPMISPQMFAEIVGPNLKRVATLLRQHGCDIIWTDCDGDVRPLIPPLLEAGVNCMFPLEVHPGSDPVAIRREYGHQVLLRGGFKKSVLAQGKAEILAELKRLAPVVEDGGFIPHGDHRIPEDVPYDNYRYYVREKLAMLGWPAEEVNGVWPVKGLPSDFRQISKPASQESWNGLPRTMQYHLL